MTQTMDLGWPQEPLRYGHVALREFRDDDVAFARELSTDPYVPLVGSLPGHATERQAGEWVERQRRRLVEGVGFSFAVADVATDMAVGQIGLWLAPLAEGRATVGYGIAPSARGRGVATAALQALTAFAWTIPTLHRIELYIEPTNIASVRTAEHAGYSREGLLHSHQQIGDDRRDMLLYAAIRPPSERAATN